MATSSVFTTIKVTDKKSAELMVDALDAAAKAQKTNKTRVATVKELKGNDLLTFLKGK